MDRNATVEQHYRENQEKLVNTMARHVPYEDAEDAVQDAYVRAMEYWDKFDPALGSFGQWFNQIRKRKQIDLVNAGKVEFEELSSGQLVCFGDPFDNLLLARLVDSMELRRPMHAYVLKQILIVGENVQEFCERTNITENNVWLIVHRFRQEHSDD